MKKITFLTTVIICSLVNIYAQDFELDDSNTSPAYFVVMHVDGSAKYLNAEGSTSQNLKSGMILPETGTLTLNKKAQVQLSWKNQSVTLIKKGTYSLKNEAKKLANSIPGEPVLDDFLIELGAASGYGEDEDGERKSGTAQHDTTGGSGWGTDKSINIIMPIGGVVPLNSITFSWAGISEDSGFRINVYKDSGKPAIFSAKTNNNSFSLDVSQLSVDMDEEYFWDVENASDPKIKSEKTNIIFTDKDQDKEVLRGMQSAREYSYSDPWLKLLREAHALQKANMLYAANEKYKQGLIEFSDNLTIKKMYAMFLTNHGLGALAGSVLK